MAMSDTEIGSVIHDMGATVPLCAKTRVSGFYRGESTARPGERNERNLARLRKRNNGSVVLSSRPD